MALKMQRTEGRDKVQSRGIVQSSTDLSIEVMHSLKSCCLLHLTQYLSAKRVKITLFSGHFCLFAYSDKVFSLPTFILEIINKQ